MGLHYPDCGVEGCDYELTGCGLAKLGIETIDVDPDVPVVLVPECTAANATKRVILELEW